MNPAQLAMQETAGVSPRRLFVGNLSRFTSERELWVFCARHGPVHSVRLVLDPRTGQPNGFGFVEYETDAAAEQGLLALNGAMLHGRLLSASVARHRTLQP